MKATFRWLSCLAFVMLGSQLLAHSMEDRITELEKEMQEVGATNPQGTFGAGFTTAGTEGANGWYIWIEPLYWHAKAGATEYAYSDKTVTVFAGQQDFYLQPPIEGRVKDEEFGWEWALRFGIGSYFFHDNWDVNLNYTWFESDDSSGTTKIEPSAVISLKLPDSIPWRHARSHHDLNYNNLNLEIGREYFISRTISTRPEIGLKSSWIYDRQKVRYSEVFVPGFPQLSNIHGRMKDKSVMWGLGPRMGVTVNGYIGDGFSLYGRLTGSLLYSYTRSSMSTGIDVNFPGAVVPNPIRMHLRNNQHHFVPTAQMMLGLVWETYINDKRQHITLGAGYEVEYFWRANQTLLTDDTSTALDIAAPRRLAVHRASEDIMFYGITIKARLDF
ncbi:Lpg1974 family pore-forming outer membrane protein [Simkania sp.]|uniref:Lpg1974 family pore-forming outer membrane protein n=1 Tax=Simkania sp. TaxID=34094 RepID=UPI003B5295BA